MVSEKAYLYFPMGFTKLFASIVNSTVWREEMHVKVVWVTMLALANRHGEVHASVPGLADASRVSLEQCVAALERLSSPDKWSRTKTHEGRRIKEIEGGWLIYTYQKHRNIRDAEERRIQTREAVRRYRAKKAPSLTVSTVSHGKPQKAQAEAEAEADTSTTSAPSGAGRRVSHRKTHPTWLTPYAEAWVARCGSPPWGQLAKHLAPVQEKYGAVHTLVAFKAYLAETDPQYASPARFTATTAKWGLGNGARAARPQQQTADEADRRAGIPLPGDSHGA